MRLTGSAAMSPSELPSATARAKRSLSAATMATAAMYRWLGGLLIWCGGLVGFGWWVTRRLGSINHNRIAIKYALEGLAERLGVDGHQHQVHLAQEVAVGVGVLGCGVS